MNEVVAANQEKAQEVVEKADDYKPSCRHSFEALVNMATPTGSEGSVVGLELCLEGGGHRVQVDEGDGEGGPAHDQGHQAVGGGVDGGQLEEACTVSL